MSSATALKFREDAKQLASKRLQDRKRNVLVLIMRHLADAGYLQACQKLQSEANLSLDQVLAHLHNKGMVRRTFAAIIQKRAGK